MKTPPPQHRAPSWARGRGGRGGANARQRKGDERLCASDGARRPSLQCTSMPSPSHVCSPTYRVARLVKPVKRPAGSKVSGLFEISLLRQRSRKSQGGERTKTPPPQRTGPSSDRGKRERGNARQRKGEERLCASDGARRPSLQCTSMPSPSHVCSPTYRVARLVNPANRPSGKEVSGLLEISLLPPRSRKSYRR